MFLSAPWMARKERGFFFFGFTSTKEVLFSAFCVFVCLSPDCSLQNPQNLLNDRTRAEEAPADPDTDLGIFWHLSAEHSQHCVWISYSWISTNIWGVCWHTFKFTEETLRLTDQCCLLPKYSQNKNTKTGFFLSIIQGIMHGWALAEVCALPSAVPV